MTNKEIMNFLSASNKYLEQKVWYRLIRVIYLFLCLLLLTISVGIFYAQWNQQTEIKATVVCKDGTKWNAMTQNNKEELDDDALCGICTKRYNNDKSYSSCTWNENLTRSYSIEQREYRRDYSLSECIGSAGLFLIPAFITLRIFIMIIIYIFAGNSNQRAQV